MALAFTLFKPRAFVTLATPWRVFHTRAYSACPALCHAFSVDWCNYESSLHWVQLYSQSTSAQNFLLSNLYFKFAWLSKTINELLLFGYPMKLDTLILGGILTNICTWSGIRWLSKISTPYICIGHERFLQCFREAWQILSYGDIWERRQCDTCIAILYELTSIS